MFSVKKIIKALFRDSKAKVLEQMKSDWDQRARENSRHYVATLQDQWSDAEFFESGKTWVRYYVLPDLELICRQRPAAEMRILEIGCGAGRMTMPLSGIFGSVDAVDISTETLKKSHEYSVPVPYSNFN